jgi:hypothetical protein
MARGGKRENAGRPRGAKTRITEEALERAGVGETPLEYMLRVMRDSNAETDRRDRMALGAAQYCHAKAVELTGADGGDFFEGLRREIVKANPPSNG